MEKFNKIIADGKEFESFATPSELNELKENLLATLNELKANLTGIVEQGNEGVKVNDNNNRDSIFDKIEESLQDLKDWCEVGICNPITDKVEELLAITNGKIDSNHSLLIAETVEIINKIDDLQTFIVDVLGDKIDALATSQAQGFSDTKSGIDEILAKLEDLAKKKLFRELWRIAVNEDAPEQYRLGGYDEATGRYWLYDILDLTETEAMAIYVNRVDYKTDLSLAFRYFRPEYLGMPIRTNLFTTPTPKGLLRLNLGTIVYFSPTIEVLFLSSEFSEQKAILEMNLLNGSFFQFARFLRKIIGFLSWYNFPTTTTIYPFNTAGGFNDTTRIEEFKFLDIKCNVSMLYQPNITSETILYMVDNRADTNAITFSVHSDVYNRCSQFMVGSQNLIEYALTKNITIGTI